MLPVQKRVINRMPTFFENDWETLFDWSNQSNERTKGQLPAVNIRETNDEFVIELAAPGLKKEDFSISLEDNQLTIKREQQEETESSEVNYNRREFNYTSFKRSFNLNKQMINQAEISAEYEQGVLSLTLPKREEAKQQPARTIEIS